MGTGKSVEVAHRHDAANSPYVHLTAISCRAQEELWSTIPACRHVVCQALPCRWKHSRKAKVAKLQLARLARLTLNQKVLWLDVTVGHVVDMAEVEGKEQLVDVCARR